MRTILTLFIILSLAITPSLCQTPSPLQPLNAPPAGRALLSRGADLEPFDFPPSSHPLSPSSQPILGPPGFWTEPSLRSHYHSTLHLRYHPLLFPTPPPFEAWLKEQKLIRAINIQSRAIDLELVRPGAILEDFLQHEMQLAELSILLRQLQIATVLEYAKLDPEWRRWEEGMYRHWAGFLQVSQREREQVSKGEGRWERHWNWVQSVVRLRDEEMREERERELKAEKELEQRMRAKGMREEKEEGGMKRSRLVPVEAGDSRSDRGGERRRYISEAETSNVRKLMEKAEKGNDAVLEDLREAYANGVRLAG